MTLSHLDDRGNLDVRELGDGPQERRPPLRLPRRTLRFGRGARGGRRPGTETVYLEGNGYANVVGGMLNRLSKPIKTVQNGPALHYSVIHPLVRYVLMHILAQIVTVY